MVKKIFISFIALSILGIFVVAQEHPSEHPSQRMGEEMLSKEDLAKAIKNFVDKDSKLKNGYFLFYDKEQNIPLALSLIKVHDDKLAKVSENTYFACADFRSTDNHKYDLDIFMKKTDSELEATEISVHKKDGAARYQWVEEGGIWKRKK